VTVRKTPQGRWEARVRLGGRGSQRLSRTFDLKTDALVWDAAMLRRRQLGTLAPLQDITLAELVEEWWQLHVVPNLAASTRASYRNVWGKHILPRLGGYELRQLTPAVLTRFRAELERQKVGTATVRRALAIVQSLLSFAVAEDRLDTNPAAAVRKPRYERARTPRVFTPAEVEAIRAKLSQRDAVLVSLLAYSGPRPEEALRLTWADIGEQSIRYRDTKRHRERFTPLLAPLAQDLREWRLASGRPQGSAPVIQLGDGRAWTTTAWRNWRRRTWSGIAPAGSRPRDLRGSYVTVQIYAGVPLTTVARWCGTSVQMIDKHYASVIAEWQGEIVPPEEQIHRARSRGTEADAI
jgi:integrase